MIDRRRLARSAAACLAPLLVAACASAPPASHPDLTIDLPAAWTAAGEEPGHGPEHGWWSTFGDERLDRIVGEALEKNHDLAAAAARVDAAGARARIAGADRLPQASFTFAGQRARQNFPSLPFQASGGGIISTTATTIGASLNLSWEIDLWGRLRARRAAALADAEAARVDLAAAHLSLAGQTAKAWFALVEGVEQVALAEEILESRRSSSRRIGRRYELGLRPALDLRFARSAEAGAEANLAARQRRLDAVRRQLDVLLARYPDGRLQEEAGTMSLPPLPAPAPAGLPADLVTRRPDLVAAERRLTSAGLGVKEARASLYPSFSLTGAVGRQSRELEQLTGGDFTIWRIAGNLLQPLFQGGRLRAGVELAEARYRELAEGYVQSALRAFAEVETALAAEGWLRDQEAALADSARESTAARELAESRYDAGLGDYLAVLEAQRDETLSRSLLIEVRRQLLETRIDLHLALGGGFRADVGGADGSDVEAARGTAGDTIVAATADDGEGAP